MFAFAIADIHHQRLFLARDQLGIKPLVYSYAGDQFAFASEIQALRRLPWIQQELQPDPQGVYEHVQFGYATAPRTAYRQIHKLPPGHYLEIDARAPRPASPVCYWRLRHNPDESLSGEQVEDLVDETLRDSVKAHLVSDVPFGAFLSGGLDSTIVVSYMSEILQQPVRTFSIGFPSPEFDETQYARAAAERLGTDHHERIVDVDAMSLISRLIAHYGEPFADSSAIPTWHVAKLAREHVPMVLSGDGGDEFFCGYNRYYEWLEQVFPRRRPPLQQRVRLFILKLLARQLPWTPRIGSLQHWMRFVAHFNQRLRKLLFRREFEQNISLVPDAMRLAFDETNSLASVTRVRNVDIHNYLPSDILTKVDIASMMHGLECRTPLTDVRVAELSARIPWQKLVRDHGEPGGWAGKTPFRQLLQRNFDSEFIDREKMGFGIPIVEWMHGQSEQSRAIHARLRNPNARITRWFHPGGIQRILDERWGYQTWHLLVLEEWMEQNNF